MRWRWDGTWDRLLTHAQVHLSCDGKGRLLSIVLTPGQRQDSTQLASVLDAIRVCRPGGRGRPHKRLDRVIVDKGYRYPICRRWLRKRGTAHTIAERRDQQKRRAANDQATVVIAALMLWFDS